MPVYSVRRIVGEISQEDVDAAGFRAVVCAYEYPGMKWHQSYWDTERGEMTCIYEAENEQQVFEHAERSRIPCDEVRLVAVLRPGDYVGGAESAPE